MILKCKKCNSKDVEQECNGYYVCCCCDAHEFFDSAEFDIDDSDDSKQKERKES